ncbi:MAG: UDP-N-acetylglucosamine 2-epimerase (non-hydrolyzing) [candidate division WOR-3 bacterium]
MDRSKILFLFGTRPEAIKLAPVIKELEKYPKRFCMRICVTAQHRQMLDQVLKTFKIKPNFDLNIMQPNQTLFDINIRVLRRLEQILESEKPDLIFVQGDTTTAFVSALAGYYKKIKIAHIEAGLRTYDKYAPFPEEMNRRLLSVLTDYHFAPTRSAKNNLIREGVDPKNILVTGNTVIDALLLALKMNPLPSLPILVKIPPGQRIILVTLHRRENFGEPLKRICRAIKTIVQRNKEVEIVYPVHPNPNVQKLVKKLLGGAERIHLLKPLDYLPFVQLMNRAYLILTDSGGIQEEAPALGKPVLVLREKTERPEAIVAGVAQLVGSDEIKIIQRTELLLKSPRDYHGMVKKISPFGDGKAAIRIRNFLFRHLGN